MAHIVMITADYNVENGDDDRTKDIIMADDMEEALAIAEMSYKAYVHDDDPDTDRVAWIYDAKDMYGDAIYVNFGEGMEEAVGGKEMNINKKERMKIVVSMNSEFKHAYILTMDYDEFSYWLGKEYDAILIWEFAKDLFNGDFTEDPEEYTTGEAYSNWLEKKMTEVYDDLERTGFHNMGELWICLAKD